jgi:hypothetical protein
MAQKQGYAPPTRAAEPAGASLEDLIFSQEAPPQPEVSIDMSDLFGRPEGEATFRFTEPGISEMYRIPELAKRLRVQRPQWPELLCTNIALMAVAHREPAPREKTVLVMYMVMVDRFSMQKFQAFTERFLNAFPALKDVGGAIDDEKNDSGAP